MAAPPAVLTAQWFAVGCAACGYSVELDTMEVEIAEALWGASHRGPVVWAVLFGAEGGSVWVGDRRLLESRGRV